MVTGDIYQGLTKNDTKNDTKNAVEVLDEAKILFLSKTKKDNYDDGYIKFGDIMEILYPDGITIKSKNDWIIFGIFIQIISKILRLGPNILADKEESFEKRRDNSIDMTVYCAMLTSILDKERK